ncbi:MAG TPA: O-antigen ligase domain-containing protein, partial [Bacteroidetes bacterium]|nr:O-antigen ligase domain-containing protein [Bacteroidota bacterium]
AFTLPAVWRARGKMLWYWPAWLLVMLSVLVSYQRSSWLGAAAGVALFFLSRDRRTARLGIGVGALLLVLVLTLSSSLRGRIIYTFQLQGKSQVERLYLWQAAWNMGLEHPLLGVGPGRWRAHVEAYLPEREDWDSRAHAHNDLAQLWATTGALGTLTILLVVWLLQKQGRKELTRWRTPSLPRDALLGGMVAIAAFAVAALFQCYLIDGEDAITLGFALGLALAGREALIHADPTRHPPRRATPLRGHIEETVIVLRSLAAMAGAVLRPAPRLETTRSPDLDPEGELYCPYESGEPRWVPVCLHLHSSRWEGAFTAEEVVAHYAALGAAAVILTDHNRITRAGHRAAFPPAYEHGWGPHHHHVLVLGARRTLADRHPFGGSAAARAETLTRLRKVGDFLILAHPAHRQAWSSEDVWLPEYDAIELFNKSIDDTRLWDEALSAGRLAWGTAGDDGHDLRSRHQTGKRYLLVDVRAGGTGEPAPLTPDGLLAALRAGRFLAVRQLDRRVSRRLPPEDAIAITAFERGEDSLTVHLREPVERAEIIGPGGKVLSTRENAASVTLELPRGRTHVRLELHHGVHTLALNPLVRLRDGVTVYPARES